MHRTSNIARHKTVVEKIYKNWDDFLRLAGSLKLGLVHPYNLIRTLQKGDKTTELQKGLENLGRINDLIKPIDSNTIWIYFSIALNPNNIVPPQLEYLVIHLDKSLKHSIFIPNNMIGIVKPKTEFGVPKVFYYCSLNKVMAEKYQRRK